MDPRIAIPVRFKTEEYTNSEAVLAECPVCFALVREGKLDDHLTRAHDKVPVI